jgi:hypothetical protein
MAIVKLYNLARMTTPTTGTGTLSLGAAVSGFLGFAAAGVADGETVTYAINDGAASEIGRGVYSSAGPTLTRAVLKSTNGDAAINLSGSAQVFITAAKEDFVALEQGKTLTVSNSLTLAGTDGTVHAFPSVSSSLAPLASPVFTGDPRAPTPAPGDDDTLIATTAFVATALGDYATMAFVAAALGSYAPLASPTFTGDPRAPTPSPGDNDSSIATTEFVSDAIATAVAALAAADTLAANDIHRLEYGRRAALYPLAV